MSGHTPLPWKTVDERDFYRKMGVEPSGWAKIETADDEATIGATYGGGSFEQNQANAEFIVRACNAHGAMVEVLQLWTHDGCLQTFEDRERFRKAALAALARARGEQP